MKIALCTPCHSSADMRFAVDWVRLALHTQKETGAEVEAFTTIGSHVATARNYLVDMAAWWGADYILWIDADQTFAADTLTVLLSRGKSVIGANCTRRQRPTGPTASRDGPNGREWIWTTKELADGNVVEEVAGIGMGLCLTETKILAGLPRPLFHGTHEDTFFFKRLKDAGIPFFIDHRVSWNVGHTYREVTTHHMAAFDRSEFEKQQAKLASLDGVARSAPPPGS